MAAASTLNSISSYGTNEEFPSQATIDFWVADTQRGLDAFFNDQFDTAQHIFTQYAGESPFHAIGFALMGYVEAMLGFESERITVALARLSEAQTLAHSFAKRAKHGKECIYEPKLSDGSSSDIDVNELEIGQQPSLDFSRRSSISSAISGGSDNEGKRYSCPAHDEQKSGATHTPPTGLIGMEYDLLEANCILMSATIQFLRDSWIDYMRAAYKLRKAYRMYEHMFEAITGTTTEKYAARLRKEWKSQKQAPQSKEYTASDIPSPTPTCDFIENGSLLSSVSPSLTATLLTASPPPSPLLGINGSKTPSGCSSYANTIDTSPSPVSFNSKEAPLITAPLSSTQFDARKENKRHSLWAPNTPLETASFEPTLFSLSDIQRKSTESEKNEKQRKRRSMPILSLNPTRKSSKDASWSDKSSSHSNTATPISTVEKALESGVFFGVGLFALIFSLLPPKGTSLTLFAYYTNLSLFLHPQLLPYSLRFRDIRIMLDKMKAKYPSGRIWMLIDGKLCKIEGFTRRGVETLRDARRRESATRVKNSAAMTMFPDKIGKVTGQVDGAPRSRMQQQSMNGGMAQLQALAVYEMGWGQIWLGDYFQASETFFRLEGMNNWSRAFYHYIATCCMFADEEYDKAAIEYMQIPEILRRQQQFGGRLLADEMFAARKIQSWKKKAELLNPENGQCLNGVTLKQIVVVNPLWELIYLWNGIPHINTDVLTNMKSKLQAQIAQLQESPVECSSSVTDSTAQSDIAILYLLYGTVIRELGEVDLSQHYLGKVIAMDKTIIVDMWTVPYAMYELAIILAMDPTRQDDAKVWIKRAETFFQGSLHYSARSPSELNTNNGGDTEWENRLHVRCQLLLERVEEF
ncbi:hypothetical protein NQZ79_g5366 [Umbelopsis isabellina]|nr:hypothetical protein NQZ79_g5366 [Umbelopsis isabellina]